MDESHIRSSLLRYLSANACAGAKIQEEFRLECGRSRIDVTVIDSKLVGYEIKSDKDSFARFSNQIHAYNRVFDRIHLVCGKAHALVAENVLPSWWGLLIAERGPVGEVQFRVVRKAGVNPRQDPFSLASLLWKDEALAVLTSQELDIPKRASSHVLWENIAKTIPVDQIRDAVMETLLKRQTYKELAVKTT